MSGISVIIKLVTDTLTSASEMEDLLQKRDKKNEEYNEYFANKVPVCSIMLAVDSGFTCALNSQGTHGVTLDSLGVYLAASNATTGDYDYQSAG